MEFHASDSFYNQIVELYTRCGLPAAVLDEAFLVVWKNDAALSCCPLLAAPDGVLLLFKEQDLSTEKAQEEIQATGRLFLETSGMSRFILTSLPQCGGYLVLPEQQDLGTSRSPKGAARMLCAFDSRYRMELSTIFSSLHLAAQEGQNTSVLQASLNAANTSAYRLFRDCEWISYYTRLSSGMFPLQEQEVELFQFLREFFEECTPLLEQAEIPFEYTLPSFSLVVSCDVKKLSLALINLLSNSIRFTRPGNWVQVKVSLQKENTLASIQIRDHGQGIPNEVMPHIFEPYYSYHQDGDPFLTSGLGLAIVKACMGVMGGSVSLASSFGQGTSALLSFPLHPPKEDFFQLRGFTPDYLGDMGTFLRLALCDVVSPNFP